MGTLTLKHPLTFGKKTISSLTFRDYTTAGDYLSFDQRGGVAQRIALIASLTGTDESLIRQLRGPDYRAAEKIADELIEADEEGDEGDEGEDAGQKK
ncbi:phage tail assembly protein [Rhodocyclus tenuis]|uniref:Phage tail assembly protein n=1 Tax=Rhodocyclus gracilis TaxID=2929842 RepID=A0ABX0WFP5_9RHOO|nr:phage tail assembly protein [Rhodocyclus gracilis]MRD73293.1 phage tail assembly protein [Rhodocyclus gracilis]NJA87706.1 phage tail assembly protein [Rhodocyclus gracilis]